MKTKSDLRKALELMIESHEGQFRKYSKLEYAHHPAAVAKIVKKHKRSKKIIKLLIASLLHDTVEDTDVTLEDIEKEFGESVASIVYELTSDKDEIEKIGKKEYLSRKMLKMTSYALVIKLADRLHNCSDLPKASDSFREKYVSETRYILDKLKERFLSETHQELISKIENKITVYE